jgi:predicted nucleic acid-binding Zn ribbon protein
VKGNGVKSHCSVKAMPVPAFVLCVQCGRGDVELWSDEEETTCPSCGGKVSRPAAATN